MILHLAFSFIIISIPVFQCACIIPTCDAVFLVDGTSAVGAVNFQKMKDWLRSFVRRFMISLNGPHVGLVQFTPMARPEFYFKHNYDQSRVDKGIVRMNYKPCQVWVNCYGSNDLNSSLPYAAELALSQGAGNRPEIPDIIIVLTTGHQNDRTNTSVLASFRPLSPRLIYVVEIGDLTQLAKLQGFDIVQIFHISNFDHLAEVDEPLCNAIRGGIMGILTGDSAGTVPGNGGNTGNGGAGNTNGGAGNAGSGNSGTTGNANSGTAANANTGTGTGTGTGTDTGTGTAGNANSGNSNAGRGNTDSAGNANGGTTGNANNTTINAGRGNTPTVGDANTGNAGNANTVTGGDSGTAGNHNPGGAGHATSGNNSDGKTNTEGANGNGGNGENGSNGPGNGNSGGADAKNEGKNGNSGNSGDSNTSDSGSSNHGNGSGASIASGAGDNNPNGNASNTGTNNPGGNAAHENGSPSGNAASENGNPSGNAENNGSGNSGDNNSSGGSNDGNPSGGNSGSPNGGSSNVSNSKDGNSNTGSASGSHGNNENDVPVAAGNNTHGTGNGAQGHNAANDVETNGNSHMSTTTNSTAEALAAVVVGGQSDPTLGILILLIVLGILGLLMVLCCLYQKRQENRKLTRKIQEFRSAADVPGVSKSYDTKGIQVVRGITSPIGGTVSPAQVTVTGTKSMHDPSRFQTSGRRLDDIVDVTRGYNRDPTPPSGTYWVAPTSFNKPSQANGEVKNRNMTDDDVESIEIGNGTVGATEMGYGNIETGQEGFGEMGTGDTKTRNAEIRGMRNGGVEIRGTRNSDVERRPYSAGTFSKSPAIQGYFKRKRDSDNTNALSIHPPNALSVHPRSGLSVHPVTKSAHSRLDGTFRRKTLTSPTIPSPSVESMGMDEDSESTYYSDATGMVVKKRIEIPAKSTRFPYVDLLFVVDNSGSIGNANFERIKDVLKYISGSITISERGSRIGCIMFDQEPSLMFGLDKYLSTDYVIAALDRLTYTGGGTFCGKALRFANEVLRKTSKRKPPSDDVPDPDRIPVVIFITDGVTEDHVEEASEELRSSGAQLAAVSVKQHQQEALLLVTRNPSNIFKLDEHERLARWIQECTIGAVDMSETEHSSPTDVPSPY